VEKLLFFMGRKDGLSRQEFFDHYLQVHTLLGMRVHRMMHGYTVNLTDQVDPGPDGPDSITEVWTRDLASFADPTQAFASADDMEELVTDDRSFIGTNLRWTVEEKLVFGDWPAGELRTRTPGVKRVSLHIGGSRPPRTAGVTRVVEQHVTGAFSPGAPPVDVFVAEWADNADALAPISVPSYLVSEYRQREPER
jgi:EthD domain-containing protein